MNASANRQQRAATARAQGKCLRQSETVRHMKAKRGKRCKRGPTQNGESAAAHADMPTICPDLYHILEKLNLINVRQ